MGAWTFETYADGEDADAAFDTARSDAAFEHGHSYSGTIAEKDSYVIVTDAITDLDKAQALAAELIARDDPRVADKWGPAGAIPVRQPTRTVRVDELTGSGNSSYRLDPVELDRIAGIARDRGLLTPDEAVTAGHLVTCTRNRPGRRPGYTGGIAELTVLRTTADLQFQTRPDGWLFFGWASC